MKTAYYLISFFIFVTLVLYVKYLYAQNGMSYELPEYFKYIAYGITINSIVALIMCSIDALKTKKIFIK